jgi:hypothetical protein
VWALIKPGITAQPVASTIWAEGGTGRLEPMAAIRLPAISRSTLRTTRSAPRRRYAARRMSSANAEHLSPVDAEFVNKCPGHLFRLYHDLGFFVKNHFGQSAMKNTGKLNVSER